MAMVAMKETVAFRDSSVLLDDPAALQQRAREDGYLFFRGLLPEEALREVRRQVLELCREHGWLDPEAPLMAGIRAEGLHVVEGSDPRWVAFYREVLKLRDFHALAQHPSLLGALGRAFAEPVLAHSRNICRVMFPTSAEFTTPPHQDHLYIGGTPDTWTTWIPLGDCPRALGGLAVWPGSHRLGFMKARPGKGAGGQQVDVPEDAVWATSPMVCGDVLAFHSLTVHQALDNQTPDRLRLSVDYRYQPRSHPIRRDSMEPHMAGFGLTWEEIYRDWPREDPLKYYWQACDLEYVERG